MNCTSGLALRRERGGKRTREDATILCQVFCTGTGGMNEKAQRVKLCGARMSVRTVTSFLFCLLANVNQNR